MRRNKSAWLVSLFFIAGNVLAQSGQSTNCGCTQVAEDMRKHGFASTADYPTHQAQNIINDFCHLFKHRPQIYPKPYACNKETIYSTICEDGERKYIFYSESYLERLLSQSKWGDQFVLAHEIAHHLLGHTERAYRLGKALNNPSNPLRDIYPKRNKDQGRKDYLVSIPQRHLHELEADALALWMIIQRKAPRNDIQEIIRVLPKLLSVYHTVDPNMSTDTHPSSFMRQQLIERYWYTYENPDLSKRYSGTNDGDWNFKALEEDTEEFYAFQLLNANKEQQDQFNQTERSIRDSLSRRSRFFVDIVLGGMIQRPVLHRNGESIAATDSRSLAGGLRLGVGPWYKPHRFEMDLKAAASTFTTQAVLGDGLRTVEQFRTTYLYIQPRYVYSRISRLAKYAYRASGWMATVGASISVPLRYDYVNYTAATYQTVPQHTGLTGVAGVGYGISNWINSNGHFRLWLLYQPQPICLATDPAENVSAWMHTVSLDFSFRFW